jgi:DNA-binding CsgD family transcriptional regulator
LGGLVDKSLVTTDDQGSEVRYGLLKTVRQYAAARLVEAGETDGLRDRHLALYLPLAERAEPEVLRAGLDDPVLERLTMEIPNLRAALERAVTTEPRYALRLSVALHLFWMFTGRYGEGDAAYARALDAAGDEPTPLRGRALWGRSHLGMYSGRYEDVPDWAQAALDIGEACSDLALQARAYLSLGAIVGVVEPAGGQTLLERCVELALQAGDEWCRVEALGLLTWCWIWQDGFDAARPVIEEAYAAVNKLGYRWGAAMYYWLALARITKLEGRLDESTRLLDAMAASGDELGDPVTRTIAAAGLAWIALERGQAEVAKRHITGPLAQVTKTGAGLAVGFANQVLARAELILGDLASARAHLETAIDADSLGLSYFLPEHLALLGRLELMEGKADAARARADEALEVGLRLGSGWMQAYAERLLARLALADGDAGTAERRAQDALGHLLANRLMLCVPECLDILAAIAGFQESHEEAARLAGTAAGGRERLGTVRFPPEPQFWAGVEARTRGALGDDAYAAAFAAGASLDMDEAVAYARRARGERRRPSTGWDSLTPTELEVVHHIAAGLTNPQIGERMFISRGTAKVHVFHIFSKLGISSRSELAAEATRRGLAARP